MRGKARLLLCAIVIAGVTVAVVRPQPAPSNPQVANIVLRQALDVALGKAKYAPGPRLSSGVLYGVLEGSGALEARAARVKNARPLRPPSIGTAGCQHVFRGGASGVANIRVNQDCSLRRQAEEVVAINPTNPRNLIAGQNDNRVGGNHCGFDWSFDDGRTWGDQVPPFWQFFLADNHRADNCTDPTATFDAHGNAYIGALLYNLRSPANAIVVAKSNAPIGGAFYHTPDASQPFQIASTLPLGVVVSETDPAVFHDIEKMIADAHSSSPKKNNVYMTWIRIDVATGAGIGANSPVYFSQSTDGGATWSTPIEISGASPSLCTNFSGSGNANACDQDQAPAPVVGPDGTIYVVFGNANTPASTSGGGNASLPPSGVNQVMLVKCAGTADCSGASAWSPPVKIDRLVGLYPAGPGPAGCAAGTECLPPNGYRINGGFGTTSVAVDAKNRLYVTWADFRNGGAPCKTLEASTASSPCDNDVFYASSTDGGATWSPPHKLSPVGSAQWQPWSAVSSSGTLYVAYYDRRYGNCEQLGCNDVTLVRVPHAASSAPIVRRHRITTASMPNLTPDNNPLEAGFLGDYMWVAVDKAGSPHLVWADTRGRGGNVDEDIYYASPGGAPVSHPRHRNRSREGSAD